jgi:hypothetical protein
LAIPITVIIPFAGGIFFEPGGEPVVEDSVQFKVDVGAFF